MESDITEDFKSQMNFTAIHLRGMATNGAIILERAIDEIIAEHYCTDREKRQEFIEYVISSKYLTAESKRSIFIQILKKHKADLYKKYKEAINWIQYLYEERNVLAHSELDLSKEAIVRYIDYKALTFIKYKGYNNKENDHLELFDSKRVDSLTKHLSKIQEMILTLRH